VTAPDTLDMTEKWVLLRGATKDSLMKGLRSFK
jgi:hypothetical protein